MTGLFYFTMLIALLAALQVVRGLNAVHALLHLIVTLLALSLLFFLLGAPFAAALQVIVYAGAIMVLMVFVIMMLNQGDAAVEQERAWLDVASWRVPGLLCGLLLLELGYLLLAPADGGRVRAVDAAAVGRTLFGPYLLLVELASMLLLAALVGAWHLVRPLKNRREGTSDD
ncbi:MAG: NADH-quinone oxidoreductase subunit J [Oceanospirillaceae bacterium]|nr:NADH-quinone oxidoreductase subunit J [Oceanospirillaceae bacterium]